MKSLIIFVTFVTLALTVYSAPSEEPSPDLSAPLYEWKTIVSQGISESLELSESPDPTESPEPTESPDPSVTPDPSTILDPSQHPVATPKDVREFRAWRAKYRKKYSSPEEEKAALNNWLANKARIEVHNEKLEAGDVTFSRGLWKYSDLSPEEKAQSLGGLTPPPQVRSAPIAPAVPQFPKGPAAVDWGTKGLVGPVLEQGLCSSCWAFSAAGVVEGVMRRKKVNATLAPQQLIDCSTTNCYGCNGGWPKYALDYVKKNGITDDDTYPYYEDKSDQCYYLPEDKIGYVNATYNIPTRGNETWLRDIVASVGPVSAVMCLSNSFYNYQSGVYNNPTCCKDIQHAVLITGYGTDPVGGDYWIVKNSWGDSWGEAGYVRMARNRDNMCNIAYYAVYAT